MIYEYDEEYNDDSDGRVLTCSDSVNDDNDNDRDEINSDDDDLYIIGAVCLSVSKSHYFCIQRIWSFLKFIDTFRIQGYWLFPCFLTHSVLKGIGRFHVS